MMSVTELFRKIRKSTEARQALAMLLKAFTVIGFVGVIIVWYMSETGYLNLKGVEPLSVLVASITTGLSSLLGGRLAGKPNDVEDNVPTVIVIHAQDGDVSRVTPEELPSVLKEKKSTQRILIVD